MARMKGRSRFSLGGAVPERVQADRVWNARKHVPVPSDFDSTGGWLLRPRQDKPRKQPPPGARLLPPAM